MKITFHGAAKTTTGSMHLLTIQGKRVLLDCGLYQGRRKEAFERNRNLPFEPKEIDAVILSHAHIDHSGNLPTLVRRGFNGPIYATPATMDLCDIMLRDSAYLQSRDVEYVNKKRARQHKQPFEPLYEPKDVEATLALFKPVDYSKPFDPAPGATAMFHDAGHLLGSAFTTIDITEGGTTKRLMYSGDVGRKNQPILRDPTVVHDVDWLITESTYGDREHPAREDVIGRLKGFIDDICLQKSKLIIPAFSVGRTQNIVHFLNELYNAGRICPLPVYVDSPLSTKATGVYEAHPECYDAETMKDVIEGDKPFQFRGLKYITDVEDSKKLNTVKGPVIIISASGMCEGGRIVHHLKNSIEEPRNIILIVGYQAEHTLGRRIVDHVDPIRIFGEEYHLNARVHTINALSAHADRNEMLAYYKEMGPKVEKAFVVHGEPQYAEAFAGSLREIGAQDVIVPNPDDSFDLT